MTDPYTVLGVVPTATADEITRAYRHHLRTHHPDSSQGAGCDDTLRQVIAAYALLRDPDRRATYDRSSQRTPKVQRTSGRTRITVRRRGADTADTRCPPLRAGPVRWHRTD